MLKGLGALILIIGSVGYGISYSLGQKHTLKELENFQYFFRLLESEVSYHKESIPEAVYQVGKRFGGRIGELVCCLMEKMYAENDGFFAEYWIQGLQEYWKESTLCASERKLIEEFVNCVGCRDDSLQISLLSEYREKLERHRKRKEEMLKGQQRVVMGVSAVGGLVLTILLL